MEIEIIRDLGYTRQEWNQLSYAERTYETTGYLDKKWRLAMQMYDENEERRQESERKARQRSRASRLRPRTRSRVRRRR